MLRRKKKHRYQLMNTYSGTFQLNKQMNPVIHTNLSVDPDSYRLPEKDQTGTGPPEIAWYDRKYGGGILKQKYKGEHHMPMITKKGLKMASYCGPGTNLEKRQKDGTKPLNFTDEVCMEHDFNYLDISESGLSSRQKGKQVRKADGLMLRRLKGHNNPNAMIAKSAIKSKVLAEDLHLMKKSKFVGGEYENSLLPHERLKLNIMRRQKKPKKKNLRNILKGLSL